MESFEQKLIKASERRSEFIAKKYFHSDEKINIVKGRRDSLVQEMDIKVFNLESTVDRKLESAKSRRT